MTPAAEFWESAYQAAKGRARAAPTRNALALRRRREQLKAAALCVFCGHRPGAPALCEVCRAEQAANRKEREREDRAALEASDPRAR
jgi:hypothetical protein